MKEILNSKEIKDYFFEFLEQNLLSKYDLIPKKQVQNGQKSLTKINFLGDSITAGSRLKNPGKQRFTSLLEGALRIKCHNSGLSGSRIAKVANDKILSFLDRVKNLCTTAEFTFIFGGVNDYKNGTKLGGKCSNIEGANKEKDGGVELVVNTINSINENNTFYSAVQSLLDTLINKFKKENLCFILPLPTKRKSPLGLGLSAYTDVIKEICGEKQVDFVDFSSSFSDKGLFVDGLHPNERGHEILKDLIEKYLVEKGVVKNDMEECDFGEKSNLK